MSGTHQTCHYKLVLLGDTAVGKSCLVVRFVRDEFFEFQEPTIGAAFLTQRLVLDNTTVKFEIWDTAGTRPCTFSAPLLSETNKCPAQLGPLRVVGASSSLKNSVCLFCSFCVFRTRAVP